MADLPEGWTSCKLGDVLVGIVGGGTPARKVAAYWGGEIPWASVKDLRTDRLGATEERITRLGLENSSARMVPRGSVVVATRMAVGRVASTEVDLAINQDLKALLANEAIDGRFLFHFMVQNAGQLASFGIGTTVNGIPLQILRDLPLLLPVVAEQRAIAAILDTIDEAIERTDAVIAASETLRRTLLGELLTRGLPGRHTEWRDGAGLGPVPACWETSTLGACLATTPTNGIYKPASDRGTGVVLIRILDFGSGRMHRLSGFDRVEATGDEIVRYEVKAGDILVNRVNSGENVAKAVLFPGVGEAAVFESNMMRLRVNDKVSPRFLEMHLCGPRARAHFRARAKKAVQQESVNQQDVVSLPIALPSPGEQAAICAIADSVQQLQDQTVAFLSALRAAKSVVAEAILSGRVRVPHLGSARRPGSP